MRQRCGELAHGRERLAIRQLAQRATQALGHRVERACHLSDLVAPGRLDAAIQLAPRDGFRGGRQPAERPRHPGRQKHRDHHHHARYYQ